MTLSPTLVDLLRPCIIPYLLPHHLSIDSSAAPPPLLCLSCFYASRGFFAMFYSLDEKPDPKLDWFQCGEQNFT